MRTLNTPISEEDRRAQSELLAQILGPTTDVAGQIRDVLRSREQDEADGVDTPTIVLHGKPE